MAHGIEDWATTSLEGDVADIRTSPSRGCESLQMTTFSRSPTFIDARYTFDTNGEPSKRGTCDTLGWCMKPMYVGWAHFSPSHPSTSVDASMMAIVMPIAVKESPLRPHFCSDAFMAVHHPGGATRGEPWWCPPPISANYNKWISCCTCRVDQPTIGRWHPIPASCFYNRCQGVYTNRWCAVIEGILLPLFFL